MRQGDLGDILGRRGLWATMQGKDHTALEAVSPLF